MMKKSFLFAMACLAALCGLVSCEETVKGNFTPEIHCTYPVLNPYYVMDTLCYQDTLPVVYDYTNGYYQLQDTVSVGDSIMMKVIWYGVINNLVATSATWDSTAMNVKFLINSEIEAALNKSLTDQKKCYLYFNTGYNSVTFPVFFYPKKSGVTKVSLKIETDSQYSPSGITIAFPIR